MRSSADRDPTVTALSSPETYQIDSVSGTPLGWSSFCPNRGRELFRNFNPLLAAEIFQE